MPLLYQHVKNIRDFRLSSKSAGTRKLADKLACFHVEKVGGRLKSDYRYSKDVVCNNSVWVEATEKQKKVIETTAQAILNKTPPNSITARRCFLSREIYFSSETFLEAKVNCLPSKPISTVSPSLTSPAIIFLLNSVSTV